MGLIRFAGDALKPTGGKKRTATLGAVTSGFDPISTARAVASELHPGIGLLDDAVSVGESVTSSGANSLGETILNSINGIGSLGGVISSKAPALGGQLSRVGPLGAALGVGTAVSGWMTDNLDQNVASSGRGTGRQSFTRGGN